MHIQTLNISIQTLNWFGDYIIDWARGGEGYLLTGEVKHSYYYLGYKFDSAIHTADGQYVFVYQKLGTKGLLIKNHEILREINRSYYMADVYEYPAAFITFKNKTYLVHCPISYCQLDFEDVETGEIVTNIATRKPSDIFHSRLEVSQNGKYLMSKGWVWHPVDVITVFNIDECFLNPVLLDKVDYEFPDVGSEICTASFINDTNILVGSSSEIVNSESRLGLPGKSLGVWNLEANTISMVSTPPYEFGNLFAINENVCWDIYKFPKIIDISTGQIIDKDESVFTGEQNSSILGDPEIQPQVAFNQERKRLAVKDKGKVIVVTRD